METNLLRSNNWQQPISTTPINVKDPAEIVRAFREFVLMNHPEFTIDQTNESAINYLAQIAAGTADKNGLILHGNPGTGKTALLLLWFAFGQNVLKMSRPVHYQQEPRKSRLCFYTPGHLRRLFEQKGNAMFAPVMGDVLILDDVSELSEGNHFGTRVNLISEIVYSRYEQWKTDPYLETYITTNLLSGELEKIIGQRAASRLEELTQWNAGTVAGADRRKQSEVLRTWPKLKLFDPFDLNLYSPKS